MDEDLIWRIQDLLVKSRKYIDIPTLRTAFKVKGNRESTTVDVGVVSCSFFTLLQLASFSDSLENMKNTSTLLGSIYRYVCNKNTNIERKITSKLSK